VVSVALTQAGTCQNLTPLRISHRVHSPPVASPVASKGYLMPLATYLEFVLDIRRFINSKFKRFTRKNVFISRETPFYFSSFEKSIS